MSTPPTSAAGVADRGPHRAELDQRVVVDEELGLFAVVEGLAGNGPGGPLADLVCEALVTAVRAGRTLRDAFSTAHGLLVDRSGACAATATALRFEEGLAHVAHLGAGRALRRDSAGLACLTEDHLLVRRLERDGKLTREQAARHPHRYVLLRTLGLDGDGQPDAASVPAVAGDRWLLCTQGLWDAVPATAVAIALGVPEPGDVVTELVRRAHEVDARENVAAVVVDYGRDACRQASASAGLSRSTTSPSRSDRSSSSPGSAQRS